jgi:hypothetical protein
MTTIANTLTCAATLNIVSPRRRLIVQRPSPSLIAGPSNWLITLTETHPKITTYHAQAKPRHAEGPFFANLLDAVGHPAPRWTRPRASNASVDVTVRCHNRGLRRFRAFIAAVIDCFAFQ